MSRFMYIETTHFDDCKGCPFNKFNGDDFSTDHDECEKTGNYIYEYLNSGDIDYRNKDGILDNCPFLKSNIIRETY